MRWKKSAVPPGWLLADVAWYTRAAPRAYGPWAAPAAPAASSSAATVSQGMMSTSASELNATASVLWNMPMP
jgi:hypothetical protein